MARPAGRKIYAHAKLRRLRRERGMNQVELARALGLSTSYLNQIEHSRRPLTAPVLLRIAEVFGVDPEFFSEADEERLATDLRAALGDEACGTQVPLEEAADVARDHPEVARALVALHHRYRDAAERVVALAPPQDGASLLTAEPHDEVRDFFYAHHNHFGALDAVAERTAADLGTGSAGRTAEALKERLAARHGITVVVTDTERAADARRFDPGSGLLLLSPWLSEAQRAFQLATQLALLEHGSLLDTLVAGGELASEQAAGLASEQAVGLARIGLANYFAGALLMPYTAFHRRRRGAALRHRAAPATASASASRPSATGFHPPAARARGVPFSFVRVDRAGNISKRQSATDFHFSRAGGTCPLWNVYEAFSAPGRILTQVAEMPDGKSYFWVARTVTRGGFGHRAPRADFAVGLGCELRHAHRLVYSDGLDLDDPGRSPPSGSAAASANGRTAPSGPGPRPGAGWPSTPTGAPMCRTRWSPTAGPHRPRGSAVGELRRPLLDEAPSCPPSGRRWRTPRGTAGVRSGRPRRASSRRPGSTASLAIIATGFDIPATVSATASASVSRSVGRDDPGHQPGPLGLLGVHDAAGEAQVHRLGLADRAGQPLGAADAGDHPELDLGLAEDGGIRGDHDVAQHRQLAAAARGRSRRRRRSVGVRSWPSRSQAGEPVG